jgi:hypothetical protein
MSHKRPDWADSPNGFSVIGTGVFFSGPKTRFFFRLEPETRTMGPVSLGVKQKIKPIYFRNHHQMLAAVVHRRLLMMTRHSGNQGSAHFS